MENKFKCPECGWTGTKDTKMKCLKCDKEVIVPGYKAFDTVCLCGSTMKIMTHHTCLTCQGQKFVQLAVVVDCMENDTPRCIADPMCRWFNKDVPEGWGYMPKCYVLFHKPLNAEEIEGLCGDYRLPLPNLNCWPDPFVSKFNNIEAPFVNGKRVMFVPWRAKPEPPPPRTLPASP